MKHLVIAVLIGFSSFASAEGRCVTTAYVSTITTMVQIGGRRILMNSLDTTNPIRMRSETLTQAACLNTTLIERRAMRACNWIALNGFDPQGVNGVWTLLKHRYIDSITGAVTTTEDLVFDCATD